MGWQRETLRLHSAAHELFGIDSPTDVALATKDVA
jgi:hypothetical protein